MLTEMETIVAVLVTLSLLEGLYSLKQMRNFTAFCLACLREPLNTYSPIVSILCPCKGLDPGFRENVEALIRQDYPDFEVLFILDSASDPAHELLIGLAAAEPGRVRILLSRPKPGRANKVSGLLTGIQQARHDAEVFAFADTDARYQPKWLRHLISPLCEPGVGATTGYRWYLPPLGNMASALRSNWNAGIATLLGGHSRNFAWGGSSAITREIFQECGIEKAWENVVSDDYALTHCIQQKGFRVRFVPQCLVASYEDCSLAELLEWSTRQIKITRVYEPRLWAMALVSTSLFTLTWLGCLILAIRHSGRGWVAGLSLVSLLVVLSFGAVRGWIRVRSLKTVKPEWFGDLQRYRWAYILLGLPTSWVSLQALVRAAFSRRITWRGIAYEMRSPNETVVSPD